MGYPLKIAGLRDPFCRRQGVVHLNNRSSWCILVTKEKIHFRHFERKGGVRPEKVEIGNENCYILD